MSPAGKNLVPQRKANNKSFPSPAGWNPETWDSVPAFHWKRAGKPLEPAGTFLLSPEGNGHHHTQTAPVWSQVTAPVSFRQTLWVCFCCMAFRGFWVLGGISCAGSSRTGAPALPFHSSLTHISLRPWLLSTLEIFCLQETGASPQSHSEELKCW